MSSSATQFAISMRGLRRFFMISCAALVMMVGSTANAGTILQFTQAYSPDVVTATDSAGSTTLTTTGNADGNNVSVPVIITNSYLGLPPFAAYETFVGVTSTAPAGSVSIGAQYDFQGFAGKIVFSSGPGGAGTNYLTATFTTGALSGYDGSHAASLSAAPTFTTSTGFAFEGPTSLSLSFSNVLPIVAISGGSIASFTAQNTGTFSANVVPEPGTLCLSGIAIVIGGLTYAKRRNSRSKV
jgi:hypothetical protein